MVSACLNSQAVLAPVAAGDDAGGAVGLGEVGHRPDGVAGGLVAGREGKEVEGPLIAVDHLSGLARTDGDHLREMELDARGVGEDGAHRVEHQRVHDELATGRRAPQQAAGAARAQAGELVATARRRLEPRAAARRGRGRARRARPGARRWRSRRSSERRRRRRRWRRRKSGGRSWSSVSAREYAVKRARRWSCVPATGRHRARTAVRSEQSAP